jgi:dolichol-phosphate mannosyltransferase
MVAYLIAAGTHLAGTHPLGVRLGNVGLSAATGWWLYALGREAWSSGRAGLWTLAAASATPLFAAGALILTPDTPLVALWTASVVLALRALRSARNRDWALLGVTLGLGLLSKYTMVLLPPALGAAFACTPRGRKALSSPGPYVALAVAGVLCLPYLAWHVESGIGPMLFQLRHGLGAAAGGHKAVTGARTFIEFLGGQAGVVTPVLFGFALWALALGVRGVTRSMQGTDPGPHVPADPDTRAVLVAAALAPLVLFAAASWLARSEPNWAAPAYPTAFVLAAGLFDRWHRRGGWPRRTVMGGLTLAAVVTIFAQVELARPSVPFAGGPVGKVHDRSAAVACVARLRAGADPAEPVLADGYTLASVLAFGLPGHPETYAPFETGSGSAYRAWRAPVRSPTGWYVTDGTSLADVQRLFSEFEPVGTCDDLRAGVRLDTWRVYRGRLAGEVR